MNRRNVSSAVVSWTALVCGTLCSDCLYARKLEARVSVKVFLDENNQRPTQGFSSSDAQIEDVIAVANETLAASGARWRLTLDEILEISAGAEWYTLDTTGRNAKNELESLAISQPEEYGWRSDAINIYVADTLFDGDFGGYFAGWCSFPTRELILVANRPAWPDFTLDEEDPASQYSVGQVWLHEIGHYFNLCHTHGCEYGGFACPGAVRPGNDQIDDTVPDLDCWRQEDIAANSFGAPYAELTLEEKRQVDLVWKNVMSYHEEPIFDDREAFLSQGQLDRMAGEMDPLSRGRRTAVLNLPQARFSAAPDLPEVNEKITLDASTSSTVSGHTVDSYTWDFGDGTTDEGPVATHTYAIGGMYRVRLVVGDDRDLRNFVEKCLPVQPAPGSDTTPWQTANVGSSEVRGEASLEGDCLRVLAASGNIAGRSDEFHFTHQEVRGDFELTARIAEWSADTSSSKLGLLLREDLDADARTAAVVLHRRGASFVHRYLHRVETGVLMRSSSAQTYEEPIVWLRLERRGNVVARSLSTDGVNWHDPETIELPKLPENVYAGVASSWAVPRDGGPAPTATVCDVRLVSSEDDPASLFLRGDCDGDGSACGGVSDALELLNWLFLGRTEPPCLAACDPDGSGELALADAVYGLNFCFAGTDAPVAPFPECGVGTFTGTALGCERDQEGCL